VGYPPDWVPPRPRAGEGVRGWGMLPTDSARLYE
jgi:hypothetical protein